MSCYECGSVAGSKFQMCRECVERKKHVRDRRLEKLGLAEPTEEPAALIDDIRFQISGVLCLSLAVGWYIYISTPSTPHNYSLALIPAGEALCWSFAALTWVFIWMKVLSESAAWGVASIFIPPVAYRYVLRHWRQTKLLFFIHLTFLAASLIFAFNTPA